MGAERIADGPMDNARYTRLLRALHPNAVAGLRQLEAERARRAAVTHRIVQLLPLETETAPRLTIAEIALRLGRPTRNGRAEVSAALHKLLTSGRVVRRRGALAGMTGSYWYALAAPKPQPHEA